MKREKKIYLSSSLLLITSIILVVTQSLLLYNPYFNWLIAGAIVCFMVLAYALFLRTLLTVRKKLDRLNLRYEIAVQGSRAGIYDWDMKTGIITHNAIVDEMLGYEPNEFPATDLKGFISKLHPEDLEKVNQAINDHLVNNVPYAIEFRMLRRDGSSIWVADSGMALRDHTGKPVLWAGTMMNIDSKKRHEQEILKANKVLAAANKELDLLIHRLSHDIKSPLKSIRGLTNISRVSDSLVEIKNYMELIEFRAKGLDDFISEMVDYTVNSKNEPRLENVNVHTLVTDCLNEIGYMPNVGHVNIDNQINADLIVRADKISLKSIISNLVSNAIKYQDELKNDRFVRVKGSRTSSKKWNLVIEDNGIGIAKDDVEKVFGLFYRVPSKIEGSGIGLHIVKESADRLGGEITIKSELGIGTRVDINFS